MHEKSDTPKTNVVRLAEKAGILHRVHSFPVDEEHVDAATVAKNLGLDPDRVFKTLLSTDGAGAHFVFVLPGSCDLNLKKAARAAGVKHVELERLAELTTLTGYVRGGCSPVGMKKPFPTYIDETCELFDTIFVSAGQRGVQLELSAADLLTLCSTNGCPVARTADLI